MIVAGLAQIVFGLSSLLYLTAAMNFLMPSHDPDHERALANHLADADAARVAGACLCRAAIDRAVHVAAQHGAGRMGRRHVRPGVVIAVLGAMLVVFCIGQLFNPYLLRVEDKAMLDEMAARAEAEPA